MTTANSTKQMKLKIDGKTIRRHQELFVAGDYARIAEAAGTTVRRVIDCFTAGIAPQSLAEAMKKYYAAKERAQKALSA